MLTYSIADFALVLFMGLLALAAVTDLSDYRIPNRIVLAVAALYPVYVLAAPQPVDWLPAVGVALAVFAYGVALFAFGIMGGGDVKLMTATALWAGTAHGIEYVVLTSLVGGAMGLVMSLKALRFGAALVFDSLGGRRARDVLLADILPYGVAIAAGGIYVGVQLLGA